MILVIRKDTDGKILLIVAHRDPGYANWLDTTGLKRGQMNFRDYRSNAPLICPSAPKATGCDTENERHDAVKEALGV